MNRGFNIMEYIFPLTVVGILLYGAKQVFGSPSKETSENTKKDETVEDAKKDVNKDNVTRPDSFFSQAADSLQSELQTVYKSDDSITSVLQTLTSLKNKDEWNFLVSKFGRRSGYSWGVVTNETLPVWLKTYLKGRKWKYTPTGTTKELSAPDALVVAKQILLKRGVIL